MSRRAFVIVDLDERWLPLQHAVRERDLAIVSIQSQWRREANAVWKDVADAEFVVQDAASAPEFAKIFKALDAKDGVAGILTDQDEVLAPVAEAARAAGIQFTDPDAVAICRDKLQFRQYIVDARTSPRFCWLAASAGLGEAVGKIGYPCVVKPARGSGSRICYPLYSDNHARWYEEELASLIPRLPRHMHWLLEGGLICEEWLEGPVVSTAVAATGYQVGAVSCAIHLKHTENPCTGFGSVSFDPAMGGMIGRCTEMAERLVRDLGLRLGFFDVEMVLTERGPKALEINARPMGGEMITAFAMRTRTDAYGFLVDLYCGRPVSIPLPLTGFETGIFKIVAKNDGNLSEALDLELIRGLLPVGALLRSYRLRPRATVSTLEVLGRVLVAGAAVPEQLAVLDNRMIDIGDMIGLELVRAAPSIATQLAPLGIGLQQP